MAGGDQAGVRALLDAAGRTYAEEAGVRLDDAPGPLFQLLVLANLLSARISSGVAVAAARELFAAGYTTARKMADASWQERVDALGRGHYRRYDERTSTMLGRGAELLLDRYDADLRRLAKAADGDPGRMRPLLKEVPGIGDTGVDIFLREVQGVWPTVRPYLDRRAVDGARRIGLPTDPEALARLVRGDDLPRLAAALVRVSRDAKLAEKVRQAA